MNKYKIYILVLKFNSKKKLDYILDHIRIEFVNGRLSYL